MRARGLRRRPRACHRGADLGGSQARSDRRDRRPDVAQAVAEGVAGRPPPPSRPRRSTSPSRRPASLTGAGRLPAILHGCHVMQMNGGATVGLRCARWPTVPRCSTLTSATVRRHDGLYDFAASLLEVICAGKERNNRSTAPPLCYRCRCRAEHEPEDAGVVRRRHEDDNEMTSFANAVGFVPDVPGSTDSPSVRVGDHLRAQLRRRDPGRTGVRIRPGRRPGCSWCSHRASQAGAGPGYSRWAPAPTGPPPARTT